METFIFYLLQYLSVRQVGRWCWQAGRSCTRSVSHRGVLVWNEKVSTGLCWWAQLPWQQQPLQELGLHFEPWETKLENTNQAVVVGCTNSELVIEDRAQALLCRSRQMCKSRWLPWFTLPALQLQCMLTCLEQLESGAVGFPKTTQLNVLLRLHSDDG